MLKKGLLFIIFIFLVFSLSVCKNIFSAASGPIVNTLSRVFLPQTGQTTSYYSGDDGAYRSGVPWPNPRFINNGNGTVTDRLTGLMWEQAPSSVASTSWANAFEKIDALNAEKKSGYSDWRLPNVNELRSLWNYGVSDPAAWLNNQGFSGVTIYTNNYWTSTTYSTTNTQAWYIRMNYGMGYDNKIGAHYVWGVRAGHSGAVRLSRTGQTTIYNPGDDGAYQSGAPWPNPRFINNGNGTITDRLTGLIWQQVVSTSSSSWTDAFTVINSLNTSKLGGYSDWRLPNINELSSLVNHGASNHITWLTSQGFIGANSSGYWTSTSPNDSNAWNRVIGAVMNKQSITSSGLYVIGIRGGQ